MQTPPHACLRIAPTVSVRYSVCLSKSPLYLRSHPTPEVGVRCSGVQHGGHHRLVLGNEQAQSVGVGDQVVAVYKLQKVHLLLS